ncbi:unnamed protein product, partial [Mesorhabditis spiculigera]
MFALLTFTLSLYVLRARADLVQHDPYHTCTTDEECGKRMEKLYPDIKFVCCATVVCGYENPYFLESSSCSAVDDCTEVAFNGTSRFAGRAHAVNWKAVENTRTVKDCRETAEVFMKMPGVQHSTDRTKAFPIKRTAEHLKKRNQTQTTSKSDCTLKCAKDEDCCTTIECDETADGKGLYTLEQRCSRECPTITYNLANNAYYQFSSDDWTSRGSYQRSKSTGSVEQNCQETRYFQRWLGEKKAGANEAL